MAESENTLGSSPALQQLRQLNPETLGKHSDPVIAEYLWRTQVVEKGYEEFNDKDDFFQNLGTLRNDLSFTDSLGRAFSRGWYNVSDALDLVDQSMGEISGGILNYKPFQAAVGQDQWTPEDYARRRHNRDIARKRNAPSLDTMNRLQAITAEDATFWEMVKNADDWTLISSLLAESLTQYAPVLGAATVVGLTGGAAAPIMAPLVAGLVSTGMMSSSAFHEYLRKEGKIESPEDYLKAFEDPELMNKAQEHAWKYGAPIGALDALSMGAAGNVLRMGRAVGQVTRRTPSAVVGEAVGQAASQSNKLKKMGGIGAEIGTQAGLGGLGEALGSLWATGQINAGEVFLEALVEPAMLPLEIAAKSPRTAARKLKQLSDKEKAGAPLTEEEKTQKADLEKAQFAETEVGRRQAAKLSEAQAAAGINEDDYGTIVETIGQSSVVAGETLDVSNMDREVIAQLVANKIITPTESENRFEFTFTEDGADQYNANIVPIAQRGPEVKDDPNTRFAGMLEKEIEDQLVKEGAERNIAAAEAKRIEDQQRRRREISNQQQTRLKLGEPGEGPRVKPMTTDPELLEGFPRITLGDTPEVVAEEAVVEEEVVPETAEVPKTEVTTPLQQETAPSVSFSDTGGVSFENSLRSIVAQYLRTVHNQSAPLWPPPLNSARLNLGKSFEEVLTDHIAKGMTLIDENTSEATKENAQKQFLNSILNKLQAKGIYGDGKPRKRIYAKRQEAIDIVTRQIKGIEEQAPVKSRGVEKKEFPAIWNGQDTWATREGGRWFVGGDKAPGDEDVLILSEKDGQPAWFKLRGNRLQFDDVATEEEVARVRSFNAERKEPRETTPEPEGVEIEAEFGPQPIDVQAEAKTVGILPTQKDARKVRRGVYDYKGYTIQNMGKAKWVITEPGVTGTRVEDTSKSLTEAVQLIERTEQVKAETEPMASFLQEVEDNKDSLSNLRNLFRNVLNDPNIDDKDQRKLLAFTGMQQIMGQDPGIFPEAIALTQQEKDTLTQTLKGAELGQRAEDSIYADFRERNKIELDAKEKLLSPEDQDSVLKEKVYEAVATGNDAIDQMPQDSLYNRAAKKQATDDITSLDLQQARDLVGEEIWGQLLEQEAAKLQMQYPEGLPTAHVNEITKNAFQRVYDIRRDIYDLNIVVAEEIINETAMQNYENGDNSPGSLSSEEKRELLEFIQRLVGRSVSVIFDNVQAMTETVRKNQAIPSNVVVQGYANPLDRTIVLALDRKFSKQVAGEEAFHIAQRIALNKDELAILEGYDWVHIAKENDIDVSSYPINLQAYEAQAKVFAKYITGEKVKGIGPQSKSLLQAVKDFLNKLANFARGRGWKKRFPTPIDIFVTIDKGDLTKREFHYPVGPMPENFYDLNQKEFDNIVEQKAKADKEADHIMSFGWFNRLLEHPMKLAAKSPWARPIIALLDQMERFQNSLVSEGFEGMRPFSESSVETQAEVSKFYHLLDFIATGRNLEQMQGIIVEQDGRVVLNIPTAEEDGQLFDDQLRALKYEHLMGGQINGVKIEPGATIELKTQPEGTVPGSIFANKYSQVDAYNGFKKGSAFRRHLIEQAVMMKLAELPHDSTIEDLRALVNYQEGEVARLLDDEVALEEANKRLNVLNYALQAIETLQNNPYYMPRMRNGTDKITVREILGVKDGKEELGPIQHMEVDSRRKLERSSKFREVQNARVKQLEKMFGSGFKVEKGKFNLNQVLEDALKAGKEGRQADFVVISGLTMLEQGFNAVSIPEHDAARGVLAALKKIAEQRKPIEGINEARQPQNITGHWREDVDGYANTVAKRQLHTLSYQLGKIKYGPAIEEEEQHLSKLIEEAEDSENYERVTTLKATEKYIKKYLDFTNDPVNRGSFVRNVIFHMALGGRPSSAILNNFQLPQATWALLCSINPGNFGIVTPYKVIANAALMASAYKTAVRLAFRSGLGTPQSAYAQKLEGPKPSYIEDEGMWSMIKQLSREGINAPVNMEDLSDSRNWKELWRTAERQKYIGGLPAPTLGGTLNGLSNVSSYMFAFTEYVNRAATAIAVYKLAKDPRLGDQVRNNLNIIKEQSYMKESERLPQMNLGNDQEGWTNAAHIGVVETQFKMGKMNRPQLFYLGNKGDLGSLAPIATQFQSFPFQYLEMYFKNIRRVIKGKSKAERMIGINMGAMMAIAMVGMAGAFGLPFMENLRRLLLQFSDLDMQKSMRHLLHEDLGLGAEATNLIVDGSLFTYAGFEGKNRVGVGTMVDSGFVQGDVGAVFGPLGGMVETSLAYIVDGIKRGDTAMIARGIMPIGGLRDMLGFADAMDRGIRTRSGNILLSPEDMSIGDYWTKFIGFYPSRAALRRDNLAYAILERNVGQNRRDIVLDRVIDLMRKARTSSSASAKQDYIEEYVETLRNYNRRAAKNRWPIINNRLIGRRLLAVANPTAAQLKTVPKNRRADYYNAAKLLEALEGGLR